MKNELGSLKLQLKSKDKDIFAKEGVITRGVLDAKEILATGNYEEVLPVVKKKVVETKTEDKVEESTIETLIASMNGKALAEFVQEKGLDVDLSTGNLVSKRQAVLEALDSIDENEEF